MNIGDVEEGGLSDDSGRWVSLNIKDTELNFSFDIKGETIDGIGLYKDVIQVVDQDRIWGK